MRPLRVLIGVALLSGAFGACGLDPQGIPTATSSATAAAGSTGSGGSGASSSTTAAVGGTGGAGTGGVSTSSSGGAATGSGGTGVGGAGGIAPVDCQGTGEFHGGPTPSHCYLFVQDPATALTWDAAGLACQVWHSNADLAALNSQEEYDFVLGEMGAGNDDTWIGGYDPGSGGDKATFIWSNKDPWYDDGWEVGDAPWKSSEPSNGDDRLKIHGGFEGRTYTQTTPKGYLCERP